MIERLWQGDWESKPQTCIIGAHEFGGLGVPLMYVDGCALCPEHAIEIANAVDSKPADIQLVDALKSQRRREANAAKEAEVLRARGKRNPGFVYYIRMEDLIKIGYAANIANRMRAYPPTAELLAAHPGTVELEKSIHADFRAFLRRGREWFEPHATLVAHIEKVKAEFGDMSKLAYEYRKAG